MRRSACASRARSRTQRRSPACCCGKEWPADDANSGADEEDQKTVSIGFDLRRSLRHLRAIASHFTSAVPTVLPFSMNTTFFALPLSAVKTSGVANLAVL